MNRILDMRDSELRDIWRPPQVAENVLNLALNPFNIEVEFWNPDLACWFTEYAIICKETGERRKAFNRKYGRHE